MTAWYNEIDPYAAAWLRNLIAAGHLAPGVVDERDIRDICPVELRGFTQCHFFAGIGGWGLALRLAAWPDHRPIWTGSCPCQPFSVAGKGGGAADERHLWPAWHWHIDQLRPPVVMGEQVAAAVGKHWLDGVLADLESIGYAGRAAVVPACAVDAPHRRDRLWFVADATEQGPLSATQPGIFGEEASAAQECRRSQRRSTRRGSRDHVADADGARSQILLGKPGDARAERPATIGDGRGGAGDVADADFSRWEARSDDTTSGHRQAAAANAWRGARFLRGADGKARRVEPGVRLLAHGVPARVAKLRAFGNAIVPQVAAEVIRAYMDCQP